MQWLTAYDPHSEPHRGVTVSQISLLLLWLTALVLWLLQLPASMYNSTQQQHQQQQQQKQQQQQTDIESGTDGGSAQEKAANATNNAVSASKPQGEEVVLEPATQSAAKSSQAPDTPTYSQCLMSVSSLGIILLYFFLCDYYKIFPEEERIYTRDTFLFLLFLLFLVAMGGSIRDTPNKILNRDQTEEWRGWMQVMFVWYHYFAAKEWYNWIRIYIACYVWMTGFGNFSFFWVKKDFTLWRFLKMFFRLNFLVVLVCVAVANEYMLYYICAMHTYWFLSVYATMAILPSWNQHKFKMTAKLTMYALCNCLVFDVPGVASYIFHPFWPILGFKDGHDDIMHEWVFRAGLDHWACFVGMLCAYNYPHFESFLLHVESLDHTYFNVKLSHVVKAAVGLPILCVYMCWYWYVLPLEKYAYNRLHPYTSFIPILTYVYFRNVSSYFRGKYLHLFAWLGKITLETYLSQLHVYLQSNAKHLIGYFHGYPLLNFAFATLVYLPISHALFQITVGLSNYLLPKDWEERKRKLLVTTCSIASSVVIGNILKIYFSL